MNKPIVVNLFAGPGTGKSTTAAGVFSLLKLHGINCEYVPEFAKDLAWEERLKTLGNQIYVFAKQQHRIWRLVGEVDVIITDAPIILGLVYGEHDENLDQVIMNEFKMFDNMNYFLQRIKKYNPKGRFQTELEAKQIDDKIKETLHLHNLPFKILIGDAETINVIAYQVLQKFLGKDLSFRIIKCTNC